MSTREYPERPYCAVGVVVVQEGQVLLTQRGKPPRQGSWTIPGGGVELGETLEEAARRELLEESGLEVDLRGVVDAVDVILRDEAGRVQYHYIIVDFLGKNPRGELCPKSDAADARWVPQNHLADYALPERTRQVILKALVRAQA